MRKPLPVISLFMVAFVVSCVTVNIYFPAAAAEQAADEIIEEIQGNPDADEKPPEPGAFLRQRKRQLLSGLRYLASFMISPAQAAQPNLSIDAPDIRKLRASMKKRFDKLKPFYDQGLVGIKTGGLISIRDINLLPLKDRNSLKKLVAAENQDRVNLYQAIANANGHPEWAADIQSAFARQWISNAYTGWWHQNAGGAWLQK